MALLLSDCGAQAGDGPALALLFMRPAVTAHLRGKVLSEHSVDITRLVQVRYFRNADQPAGAIGKRLAESETRFRLPVR
jgi:hypothetical protein